METNDFSKKHHQLNQLNIYLPFGFSKNLNPMNVFTVGDQVLSEHVFAYHSRQSIKEGFVSVFTDIEFDTYNMKIILTPKFKIKRSDGSIYSYSQLCEVLELALKGTLHAPQSTIIKSIECIEDKHIVLNLNKIPVNIKDLFTTPDFSIFDVKDLPLKNESNIPTAGPYVLKSLSHNAAELQINPYYPKELRNNEISKVAIESYDLSSTDDFVNNADPKKQHLFYLMGESISKQMLDILNEKKYNIQQFPSEWLLYVGINHRIPLEGRIYLGQKIDKWRDEIIKLNPFGQISYSIAPSDRPFGLSKENYESIVPKTQQAFNFTKKIKIALWKSTSKLPATQKLLELLKNEFPTHELVLVTLKDDFYPDDADIYISSMGMSAADPLTHLSFLNSTDGNFKEIVGRDEVAQLSIENDFSKFTKLVQEIEKRNVLSRTIIPIGHFPGVVVEAPNLIRDESLSWGWGIQAWTYKIY